MYVHGVQSPLPLPIPASLPLPAWLDRLSGETPALSASDLARHMRPITEETTMPGLLPYLPLPIREFDRRVVLKAAASFAAMAAAAATAHPRRARA